MSYRRIRDASGPNDMPWVDSIRIGSTEISEAELAVLDASTAGLVTASLGVTVDANKDIGDFRNLDAVNFDAGASGTAGTVDIFPTTALKGKIAIIAADSTGDTTTTITNAAQSAAATMTIPDTNGSAEFVMTAAAQTVTGVKTFGSAGAVGRLKIAGTTSGAVTLDATAAAGTGTLTLPDATDTLVGKATTDTLTNKTLVAPALGVATATSINKVALTAPATAATLTIADGKTLTASNSLTLAGTDATTMTFPSTSATIARSEAANTFTGVQTFATGIAFSAGATLDADSGTVTLVTNAGTLSKMAGVITTESLTTAGAASQALTITNTVCAAADILLVTQTGGTNTTQDITFKAVPGAGSFVITVYNNTAATALNGTLIFSFLLIKA